MQLPGMQRLCVTCCEQRDMETHNAPSSAWKQKLAAGSVSFTLHWMWTKEKKGNICCFCFASERWLQCEQITNNHDASKHSLGLRDFRAENWTIIPANAGKICLFGKNYIASMLNCRIVTLVKLAVERLDSLESSFALVLFRLGVRHSWQSGFESRSFSVLSRALLEIWQQRLKNINHTHKTDLWVTLTQQRKHVTDYKLVAQRKISRERSCVTSQRQDMTAQEQVTADCLEAWKTLFDYMMDRMLDGFEVGQGDVEKSPYVQRHKHEHPLHIDLVNGKLCHIGIAPSNHVLNHWCLLVLRPVSRFTFNFHNFEADRSTCGVRCSN